MLSFLRMAVVPERKMLITNVHRQSRCRDDVLADWNKDAAMAEMSFRQIEATLDGRSVIITNAVAKASLVIRRSPFVRRWLGYPQEVVPVDWPSRDAWVGKLGNQGAVSRARNLGFHRRTSE